MQEAARIRAWGWVQARELGARTDPDAEINTEQEYRTGAGCGAGGRCGAQGTAGGGPSPTVLQMHVVHYDAERYANASEAQHHTAGLAVLGILLEVRGGGRDTPQPPPSPTARP